MGKGLAGMPLGFRGCLGLVICLGRVAFGSPDALELIRAIQVGYTMAPRSSGFGERTGQ